MSSPQPAVLIVDDEVQIRRFLRAGFELENFSVLEAENAEAALRTATLRQLDLIVVDLGLPDLDGSTIVERVRSWSTVPIIVLSIRSSEEEKVRLLELGADDYVVKPFGMAELLARARRCAGSRAAPAASRSSSPDGCPSTLRHAPSRPAARDCNCRPRNTACWCWRSTRATW